MAKQVRETYSPFLKLRQWTLGFRTVTRNGLAKKGGCFKVYKYSSSAMGHLFLKMPLSYHGFRRFLVCFLPSVERLEK